MYYYFNCIVIIIEYRSIITYFQLLRYLVCESQKKKSKCPVTASISADMNNNIIKIKKQHNHMPQEVDIPMILLRSAIGLRGTSPESLSTPIRELYNQEIMK